MLLQISESRYKQYVAFTQMSAAPSAFLYIVRCAGMLIYDKILLCFLIKCFSMLCDKQKNIKNLKVSLFLGSYHIFVKQSQGAITERLRSFSMHDLRAIQGEEPVGQRPYQTLPEAKRRSKQASEPAGMLYVLEYARVFHKWARVQGGYCRIPGSGDRAHLVIDTIFVRTESCVASADLRLSIQVRLSSTSRSCLYLPSIRNVGVSDHTQQNLLFLNIYLGLIILWVVFLFSRQGVIGLLRLTMNFLVLLHLTSQVVGSGVQHHI